MTHATAAQEVSAPLSPLLPSGSNIMARLAVLSGVYLFALGFLVAGYAAIPV
jgi:hypothetical protein